ncbi:hypothetical protein GOP47_0018966 [Adiantum capillus-veneris]|uniref:CBS domain-containing protein n=1 Tax=Adiantum capillus-veneris TaxID=13818 RepID=A0A9D4UES9_ADICA|nr:hypothetical protein GOP47_0018966 [Adiantum capillus-veneris]
MEDLRHLLKSTPLQKLLESQSKLIEVAHTATIAETLYAMRESRVSAVAVASPQSNMWHFNCKHCLADLRQWGSTIPDSKSSTDHEHINSTFLPSDVITRPEFDFCASKRYIGIASTFNIFVHLANFYSKTRDSSIAPRLLLDTPIHQCIKAQDTFCVLSPNSSVLELMDKMINGLQRALVPHVNKQKRGGGERELCTGYSMITQTDIIKFFQGESKKFKHILRQSVESLQVHQPRVLGVWSDIPVVDALRCMHEASLAVVPILDVGGNTMTKELIPAEGKLIVGTFSVSDLKGCNADALSKWSQQGLLKFLKRMIMMEVWQYSVDALEADNDVLYHMDLIGSFTQWDLVSCTLDMTIEDVISRALQNNVQRVWVVEKDCVLVSLVSFTDIFRAVRACLDGKQKAGLCLGAAHCEDT